MSTFKKNIFKTNNRIDSFEFNFSVARNSTGEACQEVSFPIKLYCADSILIVGSRLFSDNSLITYFRGGTNWYKLGTKTYKISNFGFINEISVECSIILPVTKYCYNGVYDEDDSIHVPPGGVINYTDEFGESQIEEMITTSSGTVVIWSSNLPSTSGVGQVTCPITPYSFLVIAGVRGCSDGKIVVSDPQTITVYNVNPTIEIGDVLYTNIQMNVTISYAFIQEISISKFHDVNGGIVTSTLDPITSC